MSTTVSTITKSAEVFTRTWGDLDPKVRNALIVWAATVISTGSGVLVGRITPLQAVGFLAPVTLAVIVAYVTTSKHKDVIRADVTVAGEVVHDLAPLAEALAPQATPIIAEALDAVDTVKAALTTTQTLDLLPPAPVSAAGGGQ